MGKPTQISGRCKMNARANILRLMPACGGLILLLVAGCGGGMWHSRIDGGMREARQTGKRVLVQFHKTNEACLEMDREVFPNSNIRGILDEYYVKVRLSPLTHGTLAERYGVTEYPSFVIFRPNETVAGTHEGSASVDVFRAFLIKHAFE